MLGGGAGFGEVGVRVLNPGIGLAMGELVGEAVVRLAGTGFAGAGSVGGGIFSGALAGIGIGVGRLGHAWVRWDQPFRRLRFAPADSF